MTQPTFFVDRSLGKYFVVDALRSNGIDVRVHDDLQAMNAKDSSWLEVAGSAGWFVLTKDRRIRYRPLEKRTLVTSGVGAFVVVAGNLRGPELANLVVRNLPGILKACEETHRPFIAHVTRDSVVVHEAPGLG